MATALKTQKSSQLVHVYSTLANPQLFVTYKKGGADLPVIDRQVPIKGGSGIASKNLITPMGVHTAISEEDYQAIKDLEHFKMLVESGNIRVENKKAGEIERIVSDMNPRDPGGPVTPADYVASPTNGSVPIPVEQDKLGTGWVLK